MNIKTLLTLSSLAALTACAAPQYKQASNNGFGYSEIQTLDNRFVVNFKMRGDDAEQAVDYALLRAAELTLDEGHDWFIVEKQEVDINREVILHDSIPAGQVVNRKCGLLGCATTFSYPTGSMSVTTYNEREAVDSEIVIVMGDGQTPEEEDAYTASVLAASVESS